MAKIKVTERVSSFGNQVFIFKLANGRTVELEFCPQLMFPGGDASCAVVSLLDIDGKKLEIGVNESGAEKTMMRLPCLWFTTDEEEKKIGRKVRKELNAIKKQLGPIMDQGKPS